jgi:hypothetical protein
VLLEVFPYLSDSPWQRFKRVFRRER